VLPLSGKLPLTRHGKDDATTSATVVTRWWTRWPQANIGVRLPTKLVVIDVDPRNGGLDGLATLEVKHGVLPTTLTVWSGREDGGRHLYFWHPGGSLTRSGLPAGLDVKSSTGYVLVPPSVHPVTGLPYRWELRDVAQLPAWLQGLMRPPPRCSPSPRRCIGSRLAAFVEALPEGNRNDGLFWAACRAAENGQLDTIREQLLAAAVTVGLNEECASTTINSAHNTINTAATITGSSRRSSKEICT
jgi:hypothetical protein